tara:strand:+ start:2895 stop:3071 length:177 start_codon:yes stop_codon:yes gene_type:complete
MDASWVEMESLLVGGNDVLSSVRSIGRNKTPGVSITYTEEIVMDVDMDGENETDVCVL